MLMKMLYLVRHAKSSWDHPQLADHDRPLGARGLRDAPFMASMLKNEGVKPDQLVSSTAKRAFSTAVFFANAFGLNSENIRTERRVYHAMTDDILDLVSSWPEEWDTVLLFGHNPTFTSVANHFSDDYIDNVPTCGIVAIQSDDDSWHSLGKGNGRVLDFWYPKLFPKRAKR